jgi:HK97 family phage portal protein
MSLFANIFERRSSVTYGNLTDYNDFWYVPAGGAPVNKVTAMRVAMVTTCVFLRANTIAQFPLKLKKRDGNKTEDATKHVLYNLVKLQPNSEMSSFNWRQAGQANVDTTGNEYNWIERSILGVKALWPLPPESVTMRRANNEDIKRFRLNKNSRIVYDVKVSGAPPVTFQAKDILQHIGFSFDGRQGQSVIGYASKTIGNRLELDGFQGQWMKNGMHTSGTIEHPETFGDNTAAFKQALKERYSGEKNAGTPLVLENGVKYNQIKVSLADQQFIEQSELNALEIARVFQVPPSRVGIPGVNESNASLEQENKRFLDTCIMPIIISREQAMDIKLLTQDERDAGYYFKHNIDALLRPDAETRAKVDKTHWEMGKPYNEIRRQDDLNPIEGGEKSYVPMNFMDANSEEEPAQENKSREVRSIASRDKIKKRWTPVIKATADKLVRYEAHSVERQASKNLRQRSEEDFLTWAESFYADFRTRITNDLGSVLREYMLSIAAEVRKEIGSNIDDSDLDDEIRDYVDGMADQWVGSSEGQLTQILEEAETAFDEIIKRAEEWRDKKTEKVTRRESNGASNSIATTMFFALGLSSVWRNRGKSCKYCRSLEGETIKRGQYFVGIDGVDPGDGDQIMVPQGRTKHPPLHSGCDCYVVGA